MRKPKLRELGEALRVMFVEGPYTSKFPKELTTPPETFRGKPKFNEETCIGCGACSEVCPSRSIDVIDDVENGKRVLKLHYDSCNFCGQCHLNCTTGDGIDYTQEYDLAAFDRSGMEVTIERELVLCEMCGGVAGTREQLQWIARRLGALAYANPTLVLAGQDDASAIDAVDDREEGRSPHREDLFRILCPSCRRKLFLTEEWG